MLNLNDREWKEFLFPEIFTICGGFYNKKPQAVDNGKIPFIGATYANNGITQFCTVEDIEKTSKTGDNNNAPLEKKIFKGNCIVVTNNGSVGFAYYQKYNFTCSHDVNPLYLKNYNLNEQLAEFLITAIERQKVCFAYVRKWRPIRMRKSKIMLPVDNNGNPDYDFMEAYIIQLKNKKEVNYISYSKEMLVELGESVEIIALSDKEWKAFLIADIFKYNKGNQNNMTSLVGGDIPLVSARKFDNGLKGFVTEMSKDKYPAHTISYNNDGNGGAGLSFYQPFEHYLDSHCTSLKPLEDISKYTMLFMVTLLNLQQDKYNHGYALNSNRIKKFAFMLPVTDAGYPDYEYMEQYVKNMLIKKYSDYLSYYGNHDC